jgi:multidrug efflux pump subunit AcrA (membrane-fusion protein)
MERGSFDQGNAEVHVFCVEPDGKSALQVPVRFGIVAAELIEIKEGLREGDQVIVSDMSRWSNVDRIRIE